MIKKGKSNCVEPDWIDPTSVKKTPYTDEQLELFVSNYIANMTDVQAWNDLVQDVGETKARQILKERFMARDPKNLVNWDPVGWVN